MLRWKCGLGPGLEGKRQACRTFRALESVSEETQKNWLVLFTLFFDGGCRRDSRGFFPFILEVLFFTFYDETLLFFDGMFGDFLRVWWIRLDWIERDRKGGGERLDWTGLVGGPCSLLLLSHDTFVMYFVVFRGGLESGD